MRRCFSAFHLLRISFSNPATTFFLTLAIVSLTQVAVTLKLTPHRLSHLRVSLKLGQRWRWRNNRMAEVIFPDLVLFVLKVWRQDHVFTFFFLLVFLLFNCSSDIGSSSPLRCLSTERFIVGDGIWIGGAGEVVVAASERRSDQIVRVRSNLMVVKCLCTVHKEMAYTR